MASIELNFEYTEADYQEFLRNFFWKNRSRFYLIMILAGVVALVISQIGNVGTWNFMLSTVLPIVMIAGLWLGILHYSGRRAFRMTPQMHEKRNCLIDSEKMTVTGQTFTSEFLWEGVQNLVETKNLYLIYNSKSSAVMLPKRAFSAEQTRHFKKIASEISGLAVQWAAKSA